MADSWISDYIIERNKFKAPVEMPLSMLDNDLCPIHNKKLLISEEQPEHGTHAFTLIYDCKCSVDVPLQGDVVLFNEYRN